MSGSNLFGPQRHGMIEKCLEFDFRIAQDIRIGSSPCFILPKELGKNPILVFGRKIDHFNINTDHIGNGNRVKPVLPGRTIFAVIIIFPVFHEKPDDFITLFLKQPGRYGRIHSTRHANYHLFPAHVRFLSTNNVDKTDKEILCPFK